MRRRLGPFAALRRRDSRGATRGTALTILCALALALIPGALLGVAPAHAAHAASATHATYYGVALRSATTATDTPAAATPTNTATPSTTATPTPAPTATFTPAPTATPTPKPTGWPNPLDISTVAAAAGQQQNANWCGIATVALIAQYLGSSATQAQIYSALNDPGNASEWGALPAPDSATWGITTWGPYVAADIAADFGTDPRSIAKGLTLETGANYHIIVDTNGAYDTTIHIVDNLLTTQQPISVFVDHGQHSVVVYGVDATANPLTDPGSITALHVWDPGGGQYQVGIQPQAEMTVPMSEWLSGIISWSGSDYFKYPYAANMYSNLPLDPDPSIGPYTYIPAKYNHLWIGHYVYVSPVAPGAAAGLNPDWELNQNGALIVGYASSAYAAAPAGYAGATVPMPNTAPPPPPPVQVVKIARPAPRPKPKATPTPIPLPTPRLRPSPTSSQQMAYTAPAPVDPVEAPCTAMACALAESPPTWLLLLGAALFVGVLLFIVVALALGRRRARTSGLVESRADGASGEALDAAHAGQAGQAGQAEPIIVPVVETSVAPRAPASDSPGMGDPVSAAITSAITTESAGE
ncbi:MAG TPA: hypothetical protein VF812_04700 [Ktedonobacterales bacterium]